MSADLPQDVTQGTNQSHQSQQFGQTQRWPGKGDLRTHSHFSHPPLGATGDLGHNTRPLMNNGRMIAIQKEE